MFIGRTDAEALILGPLMQPVNLLEKTLMLGGRDWGQEEKGTTEDEMAG